MRRSLAEGLPAPFFDLAMGIVFVFLALFLISSLEQPKKATTEAAIPKAEMLVTLAWDDGSVDDIDLYVRGPDGKIVFFSNRQAPAAFLDQDDLGTGNTIAMPDGTYQQVPTRRETVTIRAIVPGEWMANAHFYRKRSQPGTVDHLVLTVTRLNPFSEVTRATAAFDTQGQEQTLVNFIVAPDGSVSSMFLAPHNLVGAGKS